MPKKDRRSTALQGVAAASSINVLSKLLGYLRHMTIAAFIGLTAGLDAFYVAVAVVAIFINSFGDIFDSAGIPTLVKTREQEGEDSFRDLTGAIFSFSVKLGVGLSILMLLCLPLIPWLVPGFSQDSARLVRENILLLLPYSLFFLPYHCFGSFFRSIRRFHVYFLVELLVQAVALAVLLLFRTQIRAVPLSFSVAYAIGLFVFLYRGRGSFRFRSAGAYHGEMREVRRTVLNLLPVYLMGHGFVIVDRIFASYLAPGSISALFYGYILATSVPLIMNIDFIFITPLSEESDRGELLTRILSGVWIVSLPILGFVLLFSEDLVRMFFQRGAFGDSSTQVTSSALRYYIMGIPVFFFLPVAIRMLQIIRCFRQMIMISAICLPMNALLNYIFVLKMNMGVMGIAIATVLTIYLSAGLGLRVLADVGVRIRYAATLEVLPYVMAGLAVALAAAYLLPVMAFGRFGVAPRGAVFLIVYAIFLFFSPGEARRVRETVLESFPRVRGRLERFL